MRPITALEVKVGVLVLAGAIATITMVLTADKFSIERRYKITSYLNDAGGLRLESPVTLSGIAIGKVVAVEGVAPGVEAPGRIRAVLAITEGIALPKDVEAKLSSSGLFGDAFLALAAPAKSTGGIVPTDGSGQIIVGPGFMDEVQDQAKTIMAGVNDLLAPDSRADIKRLLKGAADLSQHSASIAARLDKQGERLDHVLENLDKITGDLAATAATLKERTGPLIEHIDHAVTTLDAKGTAVLDRAAGAAAQVETLASNLDKTLAATGPDITATAASLRDVAGKTAQVMGALAKGDGLLGQLMVNKELAASLQSMAVDLAAVAAKVADRPSVLVFDDPEHQTNVDKVKRDREKMRRAMLEGAAPAPAQAVSPTPAPAAASTP